MPLAASAFWQDRRRRVAATGAGGRARLQAAAEEIEQRFGALEMPFGAWHGDWVPWNMGRRDGRLHVWDWERSGHLAPCGLDAVHFDYQAELGLRRARPDAALAPVLSRARDALGRLNVAPALASPLLSLHLLEMALRFDEAQAAGVETADPKYLPALLAHLSTS
jgi:hypothetical protein